MPYSTDTVDDGVRGHGCLGDVDRVTRERDNAWSVVGYGGLGLGAYKEGSSCSSSPNTPYLRIPLSPSFPSRKLCYELGNGKGELDSERQSRELSLPDPFAFLSPPNIHANLSSLNLPPPPTPHVQNHIEVLMFPCR